MFGFKKYSFRFELSQAKNIRTDIIENVSELISFIMSENIELQRRGQKGSVVITKYRRSAHEEEVIVAQKLELPISGDVEDFEKLLSKFYSKKPLSFTSPQVEAVRYEFSEQEELQSSKIKEEAGYAPAPDLHFEDEPEEALPDFSSQSSVSEEKQSEEKQEEVSVSENKTENESESESKESLKAALAQKEQQLQAQEEELLELRALLKTSQTKDKQEENEKVEEASEDFPRLLPKERLSHTSPQLDDVLHLTSVEQEDVVTEAVALMNQAKRGMQPRNVIEYQVAVEFETTKQREIKEAEEQAEVAQKNKIAQARKQFEEKQQEITTKSNMALHQTKVTIEQKFEKLVFEEVNARMQKQKEYIESFTADLNKKMMQYIDNASDILEES